jgi:hypothetical protein
MAALNEPEDAKEAAPAPAPPPPPRSPSQRFFQGLESMQKDVAGALDKHIGNIHRAASNAINQAVDSADLIAERAGVDLVKQNGARFEMRVIVYSTTGVPNADLYFTVSLGTVRRHTDCHYRLSDGAASFNWRLLFPLTLPDATLAGSKVLRLEAWGITMCGSTPGQQIALNRLRTHPGPCRTQQTST